MSPPLMRSPEMTPPLILSTVDLIKVKLEEPEAFEVVQMTNEGTQLTFIDESIHHLQQEHDSLSTRYYSSMNLPDYQ